MRVYWLILFFLFPIVAFAQNGLISGRVIHADNKTPIPQANVFLSNTTSGATTNEDGAFSLNRLKPGQYTLIVSIVGYEDYSKTVLVGAEPIKLEIELSPKVTQLREVSISTPASWKKNYEQFVKDFIGTDDNAKYCVVQNPHDVNLAYHKAKQELEAYTDDFLIVDNHALGYRVKFLVKEFTSSKLTGIISYEGPRLFSDLPGTKKQKAEWQKKRDSAYYGSAMHFYRSLYANKLDQEGFQVLRLRRELNPNRPPESVIQQKIKKFNDGRSRDSLKYWAEEESLSKYYHEHLDRAPLATNAILFTTQQQGIFAIDFTDCLYIVYVKRYEEEDFKDFYRPLDMPNYQASIATISKPYFFDTNGVVFGDTAPLYEGTWSKSKLSDLLPYDYTAGGDK